MCDKPKGQKVSSSTTIRDVARKASVGVGTVSRVLNNSPLVSEQTRQKVLAAIDELDFRPSRVARQLSAGDRTATVGILVPFFTRHVFVSRLEGMWATLSQQHYDLVLYNIESREQRNNVMQKVLRERRVDGLLIMAIYPTDEEVRAFEQQDMPMVLVDAEHEAVPSFTIADVDGGRIATQHLLDLGHRNIAYVSDYREATIGSNASRNRQQGYLEALHDAGVSVREDYWQEGDYGRHHGFEMAEHLLDFDDPPTAVFATSDMHALGVIESVQQRGMRVPQDVSVIGFDDIEIAAYARLTTIHQPKYQIGVDGAAAIIQALSGEHHVAPNSTMYPVHLVERDTTGPSP